MGIASRGGLFGYLARLGRPLAADSDADLLDRFARSGDEPAFTAIVRRHGPMVLATCKRRLGSEADAEEAFQAVFLALARSAGAIRRDALSAWLYRVAYLISLKAAGRRARHPVAALTTAEVPMPDPPMCTLEAEELKAAIDAEVANLPERFRAVVVLCLVEGRTNSEAAAVLGIPVGTVDSRLSTARKRLQARLTRRGIACGIALSLEQMLGGPVSAAGTRFQELVSNTVLAVLAETTGAAAISPAIAELARGVTMTTTKLRILSAIGVILGLVGGAGAGIYLATAAEQAATKVARKADPPAAPPANAGNPIDAQPAKEAKPGTKPEDATTGAALLALPFGEKIDGAIPLQDLLEGIERRTELLVRVDVAAFKRMGLFVDADGNAAMNPEQFLKLLYQTSAFLPRKTDKLAIRDILNDALAQVPLGHPVTYQVRGNQLVIVPAYVPPLRPGHDPLHPDPTNDEAPALTERMLSEQIYGGVVQVAAERKPLAEILADLRKQTGANIVLDPRCEAERGKATAVTVSLNDVRLYDALRVIADMAELKMVYAGNIYYVTTPENAKAFQPTPPNPQLFPQGLGGIPQGLGGIPTAPPPAGK